MLPYICLHSDTIECMLPDKGKPSLDNLGVTIFNLNQPAKGYAFKIFLTLLVYEITPWESPSLGNFG